MRPKGTYTALPTAISQTISAGYSAATFRVQKVIRVHSSGFAGFYRVSEGFLATLDQNRRVSPPLAAGSVDTRIPRCRSCLRARRSLSARPKHHRQLPDLPVPGGRRHAAELLLCRERAGSFPRHARPYRADPFVRICAVRPDRNGGLLPLWPVFARGQQRLFAPAFGLDGEPHAAGGAPAGRSCRRNLYSDRPAAQPGNRDRAPGGGDLRLRNKRRISGRSLRAKFSSRAVALALLGSLAGGAVFRCGHGFSLEAATGSQVCFGIRLRALPGGVAERLLPRRRRFFASPS